MHTNEHRNKRYTKRFRLTFINGAWSLYDEVGLSDMWITGIMFFSCLQYLDRIGQLFFGVPPKQSSSYGGLLGKKRHVRWVINERTYIIWVNQSLFAFCVTGNLLNSLMGSGEEEDGEEAHEDSSPIELDWGVWPPRHKPNHSLKWTVTNHASVWALFFKKN